MPKLDGRAVLRQLRSENNWTPIILLTQVGEAFERAMALEEGADDYLNKPFDPHELVARIKAVLRRARPGQPPLASARLLASGDLKLDRQARRAYVRSQEVNLTPKAMGLLEYLMTHPDELVTRDDPRGRPYYWIGGDAPTGVQDEEGTDFWALANGYISVTPLNMDMTAHTFVEELRDWKVSAD